MATPPFNPRGLVLYQHGSRGAAGSDDEFEALVRIESRIGAVATQSSGQPSGQPPNQSAGQPSTSIADLPADSSLNRPISLIEPQINRSSLIQQQMNRRLGESGLNSPVWSLHESNRFSSSEFTHQSINQSMETDPSRPSASASEAYLPPPPATPAFNAAEAAAMLRRARAKAQMGTRPPGPYKKPSGRSSSAPPPSTPGPSRDMEDLGGRVPPRIFPAGTPNPHRVPMSVEGGTPARVTAGTPVLTRGSVANPFSRGPGWATPARPISTRPAEHTPDSLVYTPSVQSRGTPTRAENEIDYEESFGSVDMTEFDPPSHHEPYAISDSESGALPHPHVISMCEAKCGRACHLRDLRDPRDPRDLRETAGESRPQGHEESRPQGPEDPPRPQGQEAFNEESTRNPWRGEPEDPEDPMHGANPERPRLAPSSRPPLAPSGPLGTPSGPWMATGSLGAGPPCTHCPPECSCRVAPPCRRGKASGGDWGMGAAIRVPSRGPCHGARAATVPP